VHVFWALLLVASGISLAITGWGQRLGVPQTRWDPLSDPLLGDLMEYPATYQLLHSAAFFSNDPPRNLPGPMFSAVAYPPFAAAILAPLYLLVSPVWGFLCAAFIWLTAALLFARRILLHNGLSAMPAMLFPLSLMVASFPIARLVHQGNIELAVWIFTATGTWALLRNNDLAAAVLWGLAGALKLYPALLLMLLVPRRKMGFLLVGGGVCAGVSWMSLWWLGPTMSIAWKGSLRNVFGYQDLRASEWSFRELVANHSWFGWVKLLAELLHVHSEKLLVPYSLCSVVLLTWTVQRMWTMPIANQLLAITAFMLAFPSISYYHTLVHLYVPLLVLVCCALQTQQSTFSMSRLQETLLLFIPLFAPYTLLLFPRALLFCGLLQSLTLLLLLLCALRLPLPGPLSLPPKVFVRPVDT
jgi:hypothetical protein